MLRSNPHYLALSFVAKSPVGSEEVVRVERNPADPSFVRTLPTGRLQTSQSDLLMDDVALREPGDIKMTLDPRPRFATGSDRTQRLSVATPIYSDLSGECFGMALIESNISRQIEDVLLGLGGVECEVFVSDGEGGLLASASDRGVQVAAPGQTIDGLPPELLSRMGEKGQSFQLEHEFEYIGKRFYVDPTGRGIAIFARLVQ
jgi:hypothetical protein